MGRGDERDDAALLAAVAHEPEAFAAFYDRYAEPVFAFLLTRTRRRDLAADLTAETFAAALAAASRYRASAPTAAPWIFGIARNKMLDAFRRRQVEDASRRRVGMEPIAISDDDLAELEERLDLARHEEWLREALASLPAEQRAALLARVVDERDYADIASEVSCSPAVIRKRVSRGLATLRAQFSEEP
jgi:RNA polymerase sigma-70 factor (ECF subfamily)